MKIAYQARDFRNAAVAKIDQANQIIDEYAAQGFTLTLRQLYYQFVARDLIPNAQSEYKRLGSLVSDARLAGLIDWEAIEDRTRNLQGTSHWDSPGDIIGSAAYSYKIDKWARQPRRVEVWIEKDALVGVIERVCRRLDCDYFSCRGYTSQSEMWRAGRRLARYEEGGQKTYVLHLGDHDPSGIDMSRDIEERLAIFGANTRLDRIALNMDQVAEHDPPPNPAKVTDARYAGYVALHGEESWELDALDPPVLEALIRERVEALRDKKLWDADVQAEKLQKKQLEQAAEKWDDLVEHL